MSRAKIGLTLGCLIYGVAFCIMLSGYLAKAGEPIILLTIMGLPLSLLFLSIATPAWSVTEQAAAIGLLGLVQFGLIGYVLGALLSKRVSLRKDPNAP